MKVMNSNIGTRIILDNYDKINKISNVKNDICDILTNSQLKFLKLDFQRLSLK
jgi:hypothetical protein